MVNFPPNTPTYHPIGCSWGWNVGHLLIWDFFLFIILFIIFIYHFGFQISFMFSLCVCCIALNINTLRLRQSGHHFPDDTFKCIFFNENVWILIKMSLKFVPKGPINNIPTLIQIMAWHLSGAKPLSEPMMISLLMHICITWPQWVMLCLKGIASQI